MNPIEDEQRRFTAAWLNIVAAGVITAGSVAPLPVLLGAPQGQTANHLLALCVGCSILGVCLHFMARRLLRCTGGPSQKRRTHLTRPPADAAAPRQRE